MKAIQFREHCREIAAWVDWENTVDQFLHGDPEIEVDQIAVTWLATDEVLRDAARRGCRFVVSHEGAFYPNFQGARSEEEHLKAKRRLLDELGITLMRCHDTWDRMPKFGVCDAWADYLEFQADERETESFYRVCRIPDLSVGETARRVLRRVRLLGQSGLYIVGKNDKTIRRMAVGTGAITRLPEMYELGADLILATDDGLHSTYCGLWSLDLDVPLLVVNHATAEIPGMESLAGYMRRTFEGVEVTYLPCGFPPRYVS